MRLTREQADFLTILVRHAGAPVHRFQLPLADRKQDRVRQSCRRLGLAEFVGGWQITEAGRRALEDGGRGE